MHSSWKSRGGGPCFLWQILLRGVLGVVRKSGGESCFIAFLCGSFSKIFIGGTLGAPSPPPCVILCVLKWDLID